MDGAATRLSYRFASEADVPAVVALVESAYRGESSREGWTTEADLLLGQRTDAAMVTDSMARPGVHLLLAFAGPELVGCCELTEPGATSGSSGAEHAAATTDESRSDGHATDRAAASEPRSEPHGCSAEMVTGSAVYLGMFAVRPNLQGGGIGRQMIDESARLARDEWGADTLELTTIKQREDLIAWYERRGFTRTGELRPFPYGEPRYGLPQRDDLEQAVLVRPLR